MTKDLLVEGNEIFCNINRVEKLIKNYHNVSLRFYSNAEAVTIPSDLKERLDILIIPEIEAYLEEQKERFKNLKDPEPETEDSEEAGEETP